MPLFALFYTVGIATHYGLDGPWIECRWGRDFPHSSRQALGPTQRPIQCVTGISRRLGRGVGHPPASNAEVKERVQLHLYSPSGLSWPVQGRIYFTLLYFIRPILGQIRLPATRAPVSLKPIFDLGHYVHR